jgi:hypothetical protein
METNLATTFRGAETEDSKYSSMTIVDFAQLLDLGLRPALEPDFDPVFEPAFDSALESDLDLASASFRRLAAS